jgi:hypothetical protein
MTLSGIYDLGNLEAGFRFRITAGMTNYEGINHHDSIGCPGSRQVQLRKHGSVSFIFGFHQ